MLIAVHVGVSQDALYTLGDCGPFVRYLMSYNKVASLPATLRISNDQWTAGRRLLHVANQLATANVGTLASNVIMPSRTDRII